MKFNNKENERIQLPDGKVMWKSRASAVVGTVCLIKNGIPHFLISQRGEGAADFQGLWNLPCGYLDWNETSGETFIREVWEECGVNIKTLLENKDIVKLNFIDSPWDVNSNPTENRQNVCLHHAIIAHVEEFPNPEMKNEVVDGEVADVKWVSINEFENYEYAFEHKERIHKFIQKNCLDFFVEKI